MMIKYVTFVKARADHERDEVLRRWHDELGPVERSLPGLERCVHNPVVITTTNDGAIDEAPGFDGLTEMWFTDMASFDAARDSAAWAHAQQLADELFDGAWWGGNVSAEIEERVRRVGMGAAADGISTPPGTPIKLVGFLRYRDDLTREDANNYWRTTHGQIALRIEPMLHYVQNHAIRAGDGSRRPRFDGYSEAWFTDFASYEAAMASPAWRALVDDGPELFDMSVFLSGIVEERIIKRYEPVR